MSTRISTAGPSTYVAVLPTAARTTAPPLRPFRQVLAAGASVVVNGAHEALTRLPGGPLLAAAIRPNVTSASPSVGAQSPLGVGGTSGAAGDPLLSGLGSGSGATNSSAEGVLAQSADQNLYFLELQERIGQESRHYSAISNVLKARHDTVKNAIGNLR